MYVGFLLFNWFSSNDDSSLERQPIAAGNLFQHLKPQKPEVSWKEKGISGRRAKRQRMMYCENKFWNFFKMWRVWCIMVASFREFWGQFFYAPHVSCGVLNSTKCLALCWVTGWILVTLKLTWNLSHNSLLAHSILSKLIAWNQQIDKYFIQICILRVSSMFSIWVSASKESTVTLLNVKNQSSALKFQ